jgi:hypothetical protein
MSMESHGQVTVQIDWPGLGKLGPFDRRGGGAGTSDDTKFRSANGIEESIGSLTSTENLTLGRNYKVARDGAILGALYAARGFAKVTVSEHRFDKDGNTASKPIVWTGTLTEVDPGDYDSTSNDARILQITMSADQPVAA